MSIKVRASMGVDVLTAAIDRMYLIYSEGHRVVVSFSGGKDSTALLEVCIAAARMADRLPVEVQFRDEETALPGTHEFLLQTAARPEVDFHWFLCPQLPSINVFNRAEPYFFVYDDRLDPSQWMQLPPAMAETSKFINIEKMVNPERFPPPPGKRLYAAIGLRVSESRGRLYGLFSSGSYVTKPNELGVCSARPIYDWSTGDVWKAIADNGWPYNSAYDVMFRIGTGLGFNRNDFRIAPPTLNAASIKVLLPIAQRAWPRWFDKLCERLPGVRTAAQFGARAVQPMRKHGESWQEVFERECVQKAPKWISDRAIMARDHWLSLHRRHASTPLPEIAACYQCTGNLGCWKALALAMYNGDPFSHKATSLPYVKPSFFRPGAPDW